VSISSDGRRTVQIPVCIGRVGGFACRVVNARRETRLLQLPPSRSARSCPCCPRYIHDHAQAGFQIGSLHFHVAFADLGLVVELHVDISLPSLPLRRCRKPRRRSRSRDRSRHGQTPPFPRRSETRRSELSGDDVGLLFIDIFSFKKFLFFLFFFSVVWSFRVQFLHLLLLFECELRKMTNETHELPGIELVFA